MAAKSAREPRYPFGKAFVVQFRDDALEGGTGFRGRVEHLRTGRRASFDSLRTLTSFVRTALTERDGERSAGGTRSGPSGDSTPGEE